MKRRDFLKTTSLLAGASFVSQAYASQAMKHAMHTKTKREHKDWIKVRSTASECIQKGQVCVSHCIELLSQGNREMAECLSAVQNMLALCTAMVQVSSQGSLKGKALKQFASACVETCQLCSDACKPHSKHHEECKDCMESCLQCIDACKKLA